MYRGNLAGERQFLNKIDKQLNLFKSLENEIGALNGSVSIRKNNWT